MSEPSPYPRRLQATFVPRLATLVWWGVTDVESALALLMGGDAAVWADMAASMPAAAHAWLRKDETAMATASSTLQQLVVAAGFYGE